LLLIDTAGVPVVKRAVGVCEYQRERVEVPD
jgi:hypothetical protein